MAGKSAILSAVRTNAGQPMSKGRCNMSKKYEIMYIIKPSLDAEAVKALNANIQKLLTDNGGKVADVNEWGLRDLAYEIKKEKQGYYVVLKVEVSDNKAIEEFDRETRNNDSVLRYLITVAE
jgi:small subunit ribosomal protein S6